MLHLTWPRAVRSFAVTLAVGTLGSAVPVFSQNSPAAPDTLSPQGKAALEAISKMPSVPDSDLPARRSALSKFQDDFSIAQLKRYAVTQSRTSIAGVPVRVFQSKGGDTRKLVLINFHGGGLNADSGSLTENIPIAALTNIKVVAVLYRLAPENPFPAAIDDGVAVYRELLKTRKASEIGIYGTSAGAILGPELIARLRKEGLPQPAVLGMFSGDADLSRTGDSLMATPAATSALYKAYLGDALATDPLVSPALGDVSYFPPTLCMSATRDFFMSSTANFCRKLEISGVESKFVLFDGLPHAFWAYLDAPETDQAFTIMAHFLEEHLTGGLQAPK